MSTHWKTNIMPIHVQSKTKSNKYVIKMIMGSVTNFLDITINYIVLNSEVKKGVFFGTSQIRRALSIKSCYPN